MDERSKCIGQRQTERERERQFTDTKWSKKMPTNAALAMTENPI